MLIVVEDDYKGRFQASVQTFEITQSKGRNAEEIFGGEFEDVWRQYLQNSNGDEDQLELHRMAITRLRGKIARPDQHISSVEVNERNRQMLALYGLARGVDRRALIPRPETELLVAEAEDEVAWRLTSAPRPAGTPELRVVDVGTGSGAVAIALASQLRKRRMLPEVTILAVDCSADALELARENAVAHAVADVVAFTQADLLPAAEPPFDLILANLPYIPSEEIDELPIAASFEPRRALDGGTDGLTILRRLLDELPEALLPTGTALLEIGFNQEMAVETAVAALPGEWLCRVQADLSGRPRLAHVERSSRSTKATERSRRR